MKTQPQEELTLQENALAVGMHRKRGKAAIEFTLRSDGNRRQELEELSAFQLAQLATEFEYAPAERLAYATESLHAIYKDTRLSPQERDERLDRYLDAYFSLTIKLDHLAFPPDRFRIPHLGVPEYIPDGLVDMGKSDNLHATERGREQIVVNKQEILEKYMPVFKDIFSHNFGDASPQEQEMQVADRLAYAVYKAMPYNKEMEVDGHHSRLGNMEDGVCRQQALTFQVLAQACGLKSRLLKVSVDGQGHAVAMFCNANQWYLADITSPDFEILPDGTKKWAPAFYKVDEPPLPGKQKRYDIFRECTGKHYTYMAHDRMCWYIGNFRQRSLSKMILDDKTN